MSKYKIFNNGDWKRPDDDFIDIHTDKDRNVIKIMYRADSHISGGGWAWSNKWDDADERLAKLIESFPQMWLYSLRTLMVKI